MATAANANGLRTTEKEAWEEIGVKIENTMLQE